MTKTRRHAANYCEFKLSWDIEKNPGPTPVYIEPSKTIAAPYSQGYELIFGRNAGRQCELILPIILSQLWVLAISCIQVCLN